MAEWHLAAKEKRRRKTDAEGSGASSSRNVNVLQNETQSQMMEIPHGPEGQRERVRATKCWKPSLRILRAEAPDQVPQLSRTGGPADSRVDECCEHEATCVFVSNVSGFDLQRIDERSPFVCNMCVDEEDWVFARDDLSGEDLPLDLVVAARRGEMDRMLGHTFHIC